MKEKVILSEMCLPPEMGIDKLLSEDATFGEVLFRLCFQPERFTNLELKCLWEICAHIHGYSLNGFIAMINNNYIKEKKVDND
jgi:hypothetical protein